MLSRLYVIYMQIKSKTFFFVLWRIIITWMTFYTLNYQMMKSCNLGCLNHITIFCSMKTRRQIWSSFILLESS